MIPTASELLHSLADLLAGQARGAGRRTTLLRMSGKEDEGLRRLSSEGATTWNTPTSTK